RRQYRQAGLPGALSPRREGAGGGLDLPRCRQSQGRSGDGARCAERVIALEAAARLATIENDRLCPVAFSSSAARRADSPLVIMCRIKASFQRLCKLAHRKADM